MTRPARRAHQRQIESLLGELDEQRRQLYRLKAGGVRNAGLRDLKRELRAVGRRLSDAVESPAAGGRRELQRVR